MANWLIDGNHCVYLNTLNFGTANSFCTENDANVLKISEDKYGCVF
jgi:hypothetical protein